MKTKKIILFILMFLPLLYTVVALQILPDQIPAHYNIHNQVDRWGSKYETLIFPAITIIFGFIMLCVTKLAAKQEMNGHNNENISLLLGILSLILFNAMTLFFLYADFHAVENLSNISIDISQLIFAILGIIMIIMGNIMPKVRLNSALGLRTVWSMKNSTTWKKSQHFGGITFMITGFLILIISFFTKGFPCVILSLCIIIISLPIDILYTYKVAKKYS
ncbi:DUF1648 domain-containing protein [Erysipelotrichaceae bacterium HCN-30851]